METQAHRKEKSCSFSSDPCCEARTRISPITHAMLASAEIWMMGAAISLISYKCVRWKYRSMAGNASSLVRSRTPALRTSYHWEAYSARKVLASCSKWARRALSYRCKSLAFSCSLVIRAPLRQFSDPSRNLILTRIHGNLKHED